MARSGRFTKFERILTKAGVKYSTLWSEDFKDKYFTKKLQTWLAKGKVKHDTSHVLKFKDVRMPAPPENTENKLRAVYFPERRLLACSTRVAWACTMRSFPDELLNPTGVYKERLSQSTLYAKMLIVSDGEARHVYDWLISRTA